MLQKPMTKRVGEIDDKHVGQLATTVYFKYRIALSLHLPIYKLNNNPSI